VRTGTIRGTGGIARTRTTDFNFSIGERYLVYARGYAGIFSTNACTRTKKAEQALDDWRELGEGKAPVKQRRS
jgi:hypothetical protein